MLGRKILIVEDDEQIAALLKDYLIKEGFDVSIMSRGDMVVTNVKCNPPNFIILDIMLPGKDGITVCQEIRTFSSVPIMMLTAKVDEIDRILGLELGADDYVCKPFSPRELVTRIKNILRRVEFEYEETEEEIVAGPIRINPATYKVTIDGKNLCLTPIEFELLKIMVSKPHNIFTRNDFVCSIQGDNFNGSERIIDSHIKNLRQKMDEVAPGNTLIYTVYGMGYSLNMPRFEGQNV